MRQIIFRGQRVDNDEWVYGFYFERVRGKDAAANVDKRCFILYETWDEGFIVTEVKPETVGQFTNLKDKDGKMIFEGDIIDYAWDTLCGGEEHRTYVISYGDNEAKFVGDCVIGNPRHSLPTFEYIGGRGEVIGNVYGNKELLEKKE